MKAVFFMRHVGYIRNFELLLRELASRGHSVHVALDNEGDVSWLGGFNPLEELTRESPQLSYGDAPTRRRDGWWELAHAFRLTLDYLRYLEPPYANAPELRARAAAHVPLPLRLLPGLRERAIRERWRRLLTILERAAPLGSDIDAFLDAHRPDVVLVTPLVGLGSHQVDYVRAAKRRGIPSVLCVMSWDNLTNKGLVREIPEVVAVWNHAQRDEAVSLHGVPPEHIVITGAHSYDHWFSWRPSTTRQDFCGRVGLNPARPYILYVCSSRFVAPNEAPFVARWVRALRRSRTAVADAGILVRPHPQNADAWGATELAEEENVVVSPPRGADPVTPTARAWYFDSIFHSTAVVGLNTSALIESAIIGRPVYTVIAEEFRSTQEGTLHFSHIAGDGGPVHVAHGFDEHARQLAHALEAPAESTEVSGAFIESFLRPRGLDRPAAPILAEAITDVARRRTAPTPRTTSLEALLRAALTPVARAVGAAARVRRRARGTPQPWKRDGSVRDTARVPFDPSQATMSRAPEAERPAATLSRSRNPS